MRVAALISGGKDSCYNIMQCVREGHDVVALVNLKPSAKDEIDSYMFQTVGHQGIELLAQALDLPLFQRTLTGSSMVTHMQYERTDGDEVEDLHRLLSTVKESCRIEAVSVGAILSDYQRLRVENVCGRLGLTPLAYLWQRDQAELLSEMIACNVKAILIKVACLGLKPEKHLGKELSELAPVLHSLSKKYGVNVCGEGGEYETFTLDCPLFNKKLCIESTELVLHTDNDVTPVAYLNMKLRLESKPESETKIPWRKRIEHLPMTDTSFKLRRILSWCQPSVARSCAMLAGGHSNSRTVAPKHSVSNRWPASFESSISNEANLHISGIAAVRLVNAKVDTETALQTLIGRLQEQGFTAEMVIYVLVFVQDMREFADINSVYKLFFSLQPPARICVQVDLPPEFVFELVVFASRRPKTAMHVQSISHWAPSNIGPYSQVVSCGGRAFVSGQIPLVAGPMVPLDADSLLRALPPDCDLLAEEYLFAARCELSLHHVLSALRAAVHSIRSDHQAAMTVCYLTDERDVLIAQHIYSRTKLNGLLVLCVVAGLPRGVDVEWHVTALAFEARCAGHTRLCIPSMHLETAASPCALVQHVEFVPKPEAEAADWAGDSSAVVTDTFVCYSWVASTHGRSDFQGQDDRVEHVNTVSEADDIINCCCDAVRQACRGQRQCMAFIDCSIVDATEVHRSLKQQCGMEACLVVPCRSVYHSASDVDACCAAVKAQRQEGGTACALPSHIVVMGCPE